VEKQETFDISATALNRFMMELNIETPESIKDCKVLVFDTHFHDVGQLLQDIRSDILLFDRLNKIATTIQKKSLPRRHCRITP
jgi:hypothetical protein